jgi:hypothetical protein
MDCKTKVLETLLGCNTCAKHAEEQVQILAILVTSLIESVHEVALKTCSCTSITTTDYQQQIEEPTQTVKSIPPNHHYNPRPEKNKRNIRSKKLHRIKQIQNLLSFTPKA